MILFAPYCPHEETEAPTDKELFQEYAYDSDKREIQIDLTVLRIMYLAKHPYLMKII